MAKKSTKLPKARLADACSVPTSYKQTKQEIERNRRYAAEDAMRTLTRADEIRGDRSLMTDVQRLAREQIQVAKKFSK